MIELVFQTIGFLALLTYLCPVVLQFFSRRQNLKLRYGADWALITGASTGIGKAIALEMAAQGLNVVLVSLEEPVLHETASEISSKYPGVKVRKIGCDLSSNGDYLETIQAATEDIDVRLVFCNAGYILPGLFHHHSLESQLKNFKCNAMSPVTLTHHFLRRFEKLSANKAGKKGLICFTSSSAGFLPTPLSSMYGSTKCFMTSFAAAIASEVREDGIDVLCVHPSPIQTSFFDKHRGIGLFETFIKTAVPPEVIADTICKMAGRTVICDQGYFSILSKVMLKAVDWNFVAELAPIFMVSNPDYRRFKNRGIVEVNTKEE